ncbi:inovirus Gp2 family protein [Halomonas organivorans]
MARPLKPTFDQEEVKNFIRPMAGGALRMMSQQPTGEIGISMIGTSEAEHLLNVLDAEPFVLQLAHASEPPSFTTEGEEPFISLMPDPTLRELGRVWKNLQTTLHHRLQASEEPINNLTPRLMTFYQAFAPMMEVYADQVIGDPSRSPMDGIFIQYLERSLNTGFYEFRNAVHHPDTKKEVKRLQSRVNHNRQNQLKYLGSLLERYGTLFAVHLDVGYQYKNDYRFMGSITYERAKRDFSNFMQERRHNPLWKDDLAGFIWKLEDGFERRYHYQLILIYKGESANCHLDDKGVLQERWIKETTGGDGACYQAWGDAEQTPLGAEPEGIVDSKNSPNYLALTRFIDYLNKLDLIINLNVPKGANVYGRGHAPRKIKH